MPQNYPEVFDYRLNPDCCFQIPRSISTRDNTIMGALYHLREKIVEAVLFSSVSRREGQVTDGLFDQYYATAATLGYGVRRTNEDPVPTLSDEETGALRAAFAREYNVEAIQRFITTYLHEKIQVMLSYQGERTLENTERIDEYIHTFLSARPQGVHLKSDPSISYFTTTRDTPNEYRLDQEKLSQDVQQAFQTFCTSEPIQMVLGVPLVPIAATAPPPPDEETNIINSIQRAKTLKGLTRILDRVNVKDAAQTNQIKRHLIHMLNNERVDITLLHALLKKIVHTKRSDASLDAELLNHMARYGLAMEKQLGSLQTKDEVLSLIHILYENYKKNYGLEERNWMIRTMLNDMVRSGSVSATNFTSKLMRDVYDVQDPINGNTLMHECVLGNHISACECMYKVLPMIDFLRIFDTKNTDNLTPVELAKKESKWCVQASLLQKYKDYHPHYSIPLSELQEGLRGALDDGQLEAVPLFISLGALSKPMNPPCLSADSSFKSMSQLIVSLNYYWVYIGSLTEQDYETWVIKLFQHYPKLFKCDKYYEGILTAALMLNSQSVLAYLRRDLNESYFDTINASATHQISLKRLDWKSMIAQLRQITTPPDSERDAAILLLALQHHRDDVVNEAFALKKPPIDSLIHMKIAEEGNLCHQLAEDRKFNLQIRHLLVKRDLFADLWKQKNNQNLTPMDLVLRARRWDLLETFLTTRLEHESRFSLFGIREIEKQHFIDGHDDKGNNLCHLVCQDADAPKAFFGLLCENPAYAKYWIEKNKEGKTPIKLALESKEIDKQQLARLILQFLPHLEKQDLDSLSDELFIQAMQVVTTTGNNLLHLAVELKDPMHLSVLLGKLKTYGQNIYYMLTHKNKAGQTPWDLALTNQDKTAALNMIQSHCLSLEEIQAAFQVGLEKKEKRLLGAVVEFRNSNSSKFDNPYGLDGYGLFSQSAFSVFSEIYKMPEAKLCLDEIDAITYAIFKGKWKYNNNAAYVLRKINEIISKSKASAHNPTFFTNTEKGKALTTLVPILERYAQHHESQFRIHFS